MLGGIGGPSKLTWINLKKSEDAVHPNKMKINKSNAGVRMSSCSDDRLTCGTLHSLAESGREGETELASLNYFTPRRRSASMPLSLHARVALL